MPDIICLGEILIDFISIDENVSLMESSGFTKAPGGAPANVAVGLSRLGVDSGFIGKAGQDPFGDFLKKVLDDNNVDTDQMKFDKDVRTTLSFVALKASGARDCIFYRNPGADMFLSEKELDETYFKDASIFHFGSISLGSSISERATLKAIKYAKANGLLVSYDPNLRLGLWDDEVTAKKKINDGFSLADVVKISDEEYPFITGAESPEDCAEYILNKGCKLVVVTLGGDGCYYSDGSTSGYIKGVKVNAIETTGAGDAFVAGLLYGINNRIKTKCDDVLKVDEDLIRAVRFANCAGALATTKIGAIPAMPTVSEVMKLLD